MSTEKKQKIVDTYKKICAVGLGSEIMSSGNLSIRDGDKFYVTPSGVSPSELTVEDIVEVGFDGSVNGKYKPSSETPFHRDIYLKFSGAEAIVHTHAKFCSILSCKEMEIPPFHYMIAIAGGKKIPCAEYATFGSEALSENICKALLESKACLMAHHGMVAYGKDMDEALKIAVEVENLAEQYCHLINIGEVKLIEDAEMNLVIDKFSSYGKKSSKE